MKTIAIRLDSPDNNLILQISNDGRGLPNEVKEGLGLCILCNRANGIGETLAVKSVKLKGTVVTCTRTRERSHGRKQT